MQARYDANPAHASSGRVPSQRATVCEWCVRDDAELPCSRRLAAAPQRRTCQRPAAAHVSSRRRRLSIRQHAPPSLADACRAVCDAGWSHGEWCRPQSACRLQHQLISWCSRQRHGDRWGCEAHVEHDALIHWCPAGHATTDRRHEHATADAAGPCTAARATSLAVQPDSCISESVDSF